MGSGGSRRTRARLTAALLSASVLGWPLTARAVDSAERSAARALAEQGVKAYEAADYATALDRMDRAYQTLPTPVLALWSARALEKVGRWVEARERYLQATRMALDPGGDTAVQESARQEAAQAHDALAGRIPVLVIELAEKAADVEVQVSGRIISAALLGADLPTDPGVVRITARRSGETIEREVSLSENERKTVTLEFERPLQAATSTAPAKSTTPVGEGSPGGPSWQRPVGWVGIGLGAVGIGLGTAFGLDAIAKNDASADDCDEVTNVCGPDGTTLRNAGLTSATISTTAFALGAALAAGGVALVLTAPKDRAHATLEFTPTAGGGLLRLRRQF